MHNLILSDTASYYLKSDSLKNYKNKFPVPYFRDSMKIIVEVKPKGQNNEFYSYNNNVEFSMNSFHVQNPVNIQVFSDNQPLNNGDYVSSKPELKVTVSDPEARASLISDTSRLAINLNGNHIPYFINGKINTLLNIIESDNSTSGDANSLIYKPELINGTNKLSIIYSDGNNTDTISYDVIVSDELAIKDFYNYPNPMKGETSFIFNLTGSFAPSTLKIRIYTVSGKLIKQLESAVTIGTNQIPWDGRDDDGDIIANGTYLYKLVMEDDFQNATQTQKLVILR